MKREYYIRIFVFVFGLLMPLFSLSQISAPTAGFTEETNYPVFTEVDSIYIFCSEEDLGIGELIANTTLAGEKEFYWEKYNQLSGEFEFWFSETTDDNESVISNLDDGCYRVTISQGQTSEIFRAWVLNDWFEANAEVIESNCDYFKLSGDFDYARLIYFDLADNSEIELYKDIQVEWKQGSTILARVINPQIYDPPTSDTDYKFTVYDRFGCEAEADVSYISIVTKAEFTIDGDFVTSDQQGEAPLEVTFSNTSENGTPGEYEWFFFKDLDIIISESEASEEPVDSIDFVVFDDNVVYTYENSGTYMVKLVSKKISDYHILGDSIYQGVCTDTFYLEDFIIADTSYFDIPNFFTPNNDLDNDEFIVKFWSMEDVKITIVNRWGRKVHFWKKTNVRGFEGTWEESVWDGKIGGRYASPGVYYYVAEGKGRDGKERWAHGFFHLFRGKD